MLARTAVRSLMVRHLVVSEVEAAEFEERPLKDERLLSVTAEPRLTGALVLRRASRALLVFECDSPQIPHLFAATDPYVTHGLVRAFHVRRWNTVVGDFASNPVRPE